MNYSGKGCTVFCVNAMIALTGRRMLIKILAELIRLKLPDSIMRVIA
ncbi:hypothetical protein NBG4_790003 [Candidatus Sulfobium mesophilum]|uniref:Uncharacterized protein n=1 Tax=Candidatus Sulfobium mesophilum TaxID=2016548 RepID=A0A2U3QKI1_9BACT|nr:hypothetical protein NBG4_790003 [Candidatus Sulfobium mesophilum]